MLLAIDVGNTQTHVGLFDGRELVEHWRFATVREVTADELAVTVSSLLGLRDFDLEGVDGSIVSSVVPRLGREHTEMCRSYLDVESLEVGPGVRTGMPIRMDNPHEVGADRLVNAVAAYERTHGPCVIVDFGTAITFDAVSGSGEYLGGVIGPGVEISMEALTERAAKLPKVDLTSPRTVIGKTTQASIQSGVIFGFAGAIDGVARRVRAELGPETRFIATGGLAEVIIPHTELDCEVDDLLTLTGLRLIWERNA